MKKISTPASGSFRFGLGVTLVLSLALCVPASACAGEKNAPIVIRGSSTLQPVAEEWAGAFGQTEGG